MAGTEVLDVVQTLKKVCTDFDDIKAAIIEKGIEVTDQTGVSQYGDKIREIVTGDPAKIAELEQQITDLTGQVENLNTEVSGLNEQVTSLNSQVETDNTDFSNIYNAIIQQGGTCTETDRSTYAQGVLSIDTSGGGGGGTTTPDYINTTPTKLDYVFAIGYGGDVIKPTSTMLNILDTSNCTSMKYTFNGDLGVETIDLSSWDFSKCLTEQQMFSNNASLKKLVFPNNVILKNCTTAFSGCTKLERIEGSLNLGQCAGIGNMFNNCKSLTHLIISDFSYNSNQTLDLGSCVALDVAGLINGLPEYTGTRTKTIKIAAALKTDELVATASAKGYTLSS